CRRTGAASGYTASRGTAARSPSRFRSAIKRARSPVDVPGGPGSSAGAADDHELVASPLPAGPGTKGETRPRTSFCSVEAGPVLVVGSRERDLVGWACQH